MKRFAILFAFAVAASAATARASLDDLMAATCRITSATGAGTGCVYLVNLNYAAILTAEHVVADRKTVACEFWLDGHQSAKLAGQVYVHDPAIDAAAVLIPTAAFAGHVPPAIPIGKASDAPRPGDTICSAGCASGAWSTTWKGHVVRYDAQGRFRFLPPPAGGRSGSVITNAACTKIVGLLQVRDGATGEGGATGVNILRTRLDHGMDLAAVGFRLEAGVGCGPGGCGPGGCSPQPDGIFFRRGQTPAEPTQSNPWPTMPTPAAPPVDLAPITAELQAIHAALPTAAAAAPVADPRVDQAIQGIAATNGRIDGVVGDVKKVGEDVKGVKEATDDIKGALKPLLKLHDKLESDEAAGGIKGKIAGQILAASGTESNPADAATGSIHKELGIAGGVLFVVALVAFCVLHLLRTGKGPAADVLDKLAAAHPNDAQLQALAAKADALDAKILAMAPGNIGVPGMAAGASQNVADRLKAHLTALLTPAPGQATPSPAGAVSPTTVNVGGVPAAAA